MVIQDEVLYVNSYSSTANVITKTIYDETTRKLTSQNYGISIDNRYTSSGSETLTVNGFNSGTFNVL